jgi:hypothetical protein
MKWSAFIESKGKLAKDRTIRYVFSILRDGVEEMNGMEVSSSPENVQQEIARVVTAFAESYEVADALPSEGEELVILGAEDPTKEKEHLILSRPQSFLRKLSNSLWLFTPPMGRGRPSIRRRTGTG